MSDNICTPMDVMYSNVETLDTNHPTPHCWSVCKHYQQTKNLHVGALILLFDAVKSPTSSSSLNQMESSTSLPCHWDWNLRVCLSFACSSVCVFPWVYSLSAIFLSLFVCLNTPKGLLGQLRVKLAKSLAQINRRGQCQPLRASVVGAVAPIRNPTTQPCAHTGWLEITEHAHRQIGVQGRSIHCIPTPNLVANTYATRGQTSFISCIGGLSELLVVSNMHERAKVCVS